DPIEIFVRVIAHRNDDILQRAVRHQMSEEQLRFIQCLVRRFEPDDTLGDCSELLSIVHSRPSSLVIPTFAITCGSRLRSTDVAASLNLLRVSGLRLGRSPSSKKVSALRLSAPLNPFP